MLAGHVRFVVECIDRMYLNVYVPRLQYATGLVSYIHRQLPGRSGTARRDGPGERDQTVYERNQCESSVELQAGDRGD